MAIAQELSPRVSLWVSSQLILSSALESSLRGQELQEAAFKGLQGLLNSYGTPLPGAGGCHLVSRVLAECT